MTVDGDGIGAIDARGESCGARAQPGKEAEGTIDVQPRTVAIGQVGQRFDRIELAGIYFARIGDEDGRRAIEREQVALQRSEIDAARGVASVLDERGAADAEHGERFFRARVHEPAREHGYARQSAEALLGDVDAVLLTPPCACGAETHVVRHRRARRDDAAQVRGQLEQLGQPAQHDALQVHAERRDDPSVGRLIQHGGKHVRAERGRRRSADHEVEATRP